MKEMKNYIWGLLLALVVAILAHFADSTLPVLGISVMAFVLGVILGNTIQLPSQYLPGVQFGSSHLLEFSIIFLAFGIDISAIVSSGWNTIFLILSVISVTLGLTLFLAKKLKCPTTTGWLVGYGTAICGSSAIAALAPSVSENKEDAAMAIAVTNLVGGVSMVLLPLVLTFLNIDTLQSSYMIGATLHSVANVAGAGASMNSEVAEFAVSFKLLRVALLTPTLLLFRTLLMPKGEQKQWFKLPWYLVAFILLLTVNQLVSLPVEWLQYLKSIGSFLLVVAMAAMGLKLSFKKLYHTGKKGLGFGILIHVLQLIFTAFMVWLLV